MGGMLKVLYVHNSLDLGGAQSVRYMFLKHLKPDLIDVSICCLGRKGEFGEKIEKMGYKIQAFNRPYGLGNLSTTFALYRYIKKNNFDIIHSSLFYANYHAALAARLAKARFLILEEHGEHRMHDKKRHFFYRYISQKVAEKSHIVVCCSDYIKNGISRAYKVDTGKVSVLKNLIDDKKCEIKRDRMSIRKELNIPEDAFVMVNVASLSWVKNQHILIDAVKKMATKKIFLIIAGDGPLRSELEARAVDEGVADKIRFLGWREDVVDCLNAGDVFVLPSLSEGLPISLLEAMSLGLPCIASRVGGMQEALNDGVTGIMIEPGNLDDLMGSLEKIIVNRDFSLQIGAASRDFVINNFSPFRYVNGVLHLYDMLINKNGAPLYAS